jgi:hypothetical protein
MKRSLGLSLRNEKTTRFHEINTRGGCRTGCRMPDAGYMFDLYHVSFHFLVEICVICGYKYRKKRGDVKKWE